MHSAILHVDVKPTKTYSVNQSIDNVLRVAIDLCSTYEGIEELGQGAWLIDLRKSMPFLNEISHLAHKGALPYRVLYFPERPDWIGFNWNNTGAPSHD
jgi:hypothetical protein